MARPSAKTTGLYSAILAVGGDEKCKIPVERPAPEMLLLHKLHSVDGGIASPFSDVKRIGNVEISPGAFYDSMVARYGAEPVRRVYGERLAVHTLPTEFDFGGEEVEDAADTAAT